AIRRSISLRPMRCIKMIGHRAFRERNRVTHFVQDRLNLVLQNATAFYELVDFAVAFKPDSTYSKPPLRRFVPAFRREVAKFSLDIFFFVDRKSVSEFVLGT